MLDLSLVQSIASDEPDGVRQLSGFSITLLNAALVRYLTQRDSWLNAGVPLSDLEWNTLDAQIADAFLQLNTEYNPMMIDSFRHNETQGTAGGALTANADMPIPFNVEYGDNEGNVTLASDVFTVSPGVYFVTMNHVLFIGAVTDEVAVWLGESATPGNLKIFGITQRISSDEHQLHCSGELVVATPIDLKFYVRSPTGRATDAFGLAANIANHAEVYGSATFIRLHN